MHGSTVQGSTTKGTAENGSATKCDAAKPSPAVGFLTVCELGDLGLVGGYLLLNLGGRPIEFHCTAPVKASRAQEILYGPTLAPFLYGEQIGRALVEKTTLVPRAVVTDREAVIAVQSFTTAPVGALVDGAHGDAIGAIAVHVCERRFGVASSEMGQRLTAALADVTAIDFAEPFERIREAIREAQRDALQRQSVARGNADGAAEAA